MAWRATVRNMMLATDSRQLELDGIEGVLTSTEAVAGAVPPSMTLLDVKLWQAAPLADILVHGTVGNYGAHSHGSEAQASSDAARGYLVGESVTFKVARILGNEAVLERVA